MPRHPLQPGHAANRQQRDISRRHTELPRRQRMSIFVQHNAGKDRNDKSHAHQRRHDAGPLGGEQEAYQEILDGKFQLFSKSKKIKTLHIDQVEVSYQLDSKGYYQPVYAFHGVVDGTDMTILIPGI